ncbi:hypothetical protein, partial [Catellatospora coxensis]|uniref:hypothetical protein n=1 Tax=Catellatospora coxensis TaxID=310354 RepID=UPI0031DEA5D0
VILIERDSIRKGNAEAFKRAGLTTEGRGLHGYRHAYARGRVNELMTKSEKQALDKALQRYGEGKRADYGVHERETYNSMKAKMDQIHSELGHGKNRFDLAFRYMQ